MAENAPRIDTYGWHAVAAVTYAEINKAIAKSGTFPKAFSRSDIEQNISGKATIQRWAMTTGGSGEQLAMAIDVTEASLTIAGKVTVLAACTITFQVQSKFIPQPNSSTVDLNLATDKPVNILGSSPAQSDKVMQAIFEDIFKIWLTENLSQFNMIFASVDQGAVLDKASGLAWLTPSWLGYAVAEPVKGATLDNSVFAVLYLIDSAQPPPDLSQQVSPFAIPQGYPASFLVSTGKVLQHMFLPSMPLMFKVPRDVEPNVNFEIYNDGTGIRNKKKLPLNDVTLTNGGIVQPTVDTGNFTITIDGTFLEVAISEMKFEFSPGIEVMLTFSNQCKLGFDTGKQNLTLTATGSPKYTISVNPSKGIVTMEAVLGGVGLFLILLSGIAGAAAKAGDAAVTRAAEEATAAAVQGAGDAVEMSVVGGATVSDTTELTAAEVSAFCGWISGTPEAATAMVGNIQTFMKVAACVGFAIESAPVGLLMAQAIARGKSDSLPKITELTGAAIGRVVHWPSQVGAYTLASANLNQALQFGLKNSMST